MLIDVPRALIAALLSTALLPGVPAQASSFSLSSVATPDPRIVVDVPGHGPYSLHEDVVGQGLKPDAASRQDLLAAAAFSADYAGHDEVRDAALGALEPASHAQVTNALAAFHSPVPGPGAVADDSPIIVLGERLNEDGSMRPNLINRLEAARQLSQSRPQAPVMVTGGTTGIGGAESHAMRDWLLARGLTDVQVENRSTSTIDSARFARELLPAASSVIVVTSKNHLPRAVVDFNLAFGQGVAGLAAPNDPPEGMPGPKWTYRDAVSWFLG